MTPHEKSYLEIPPTSLLFLSRCWFLSLAVVLLEFSGTVGRRHWKTCRKTCSETAGSKGAGTGQTTGMPRGRRGLRANPSRPVRKAYLTQLRVERPGQVSPPCVPCPQAGGALGGGRGVKWKRQGQLARWTLCMGCHKKKWLEAGSGWVGRSLSGGPGLSIPRNHQDGRNRNRWCILKVVPAGGVHRLYVTEPRRRPGWDGMGLVHLQPRRLSGAVVETSTRCLRRCRKTCSFPSLAKV